MGDKQLRIETNTGIASTGDHARISQNVFGAPDGGVPAAGEIICPPATVHLGVGSHRGQFVGRADVLDEIDRVLVSGAGVVIQALTGLGGIGKSTLAREYALRHRGDFNPIWWIPAEDPTEIEAGLSALARRLCPQLALLPDEAAASWARTWLGTHDGWLLLLDNVTTPADAAALITDLPNGRFLLTSRTTVGWHGIATPTRLGVLTDDQALQLMCDIAGSTLMDGAVALCQALGNLPLAIEQAAAYLEQNQVPAAVFHQRLTTDGSRVLDWAPDGGDAGRTIARIWQVSLETITARHGYLPVRLLHILAWYAPEDIPIDPLHHLEGFDEQQVDEALGRLAAYALITRTGDAIAVHRLVQAVARTRFQTGQPHTPQTQDVGAGSTDAARALRRVTPNHWNQPDQWPTWRRLIPHIDTLAAHTHPDCDDQDRTELFIRAALFLREQGAVNQAIRLLQRVHAAAVRLSGPDAHGTFVSRNALAAACLAVGDLGRAVPLFEQNLDDCIRVLGPDDPYTLMARNSLAVAYQEVGDLGRAIPLSEQILDDCIRVLGPDHPKTLTVRNNLAIAYGTVGDLRRAVLLYEQTLDDRLRVLGPDHRDTLASQHSLASAYREVGDLERAVPLSEQTLDDRLRVLGPDHPDTLISRNNLATTYREVGDLERAVPLYEQNLDNCLRVLGPDHPNTLSFRNNLAAAYQGIGDLGRAIPLHEQAVDDCLRLLGPDHPESLKTRYNLAWVYQEAGDLGSAIPLFEQTVADCIRVLGPDHPDTLRSRHGLADAYWDAGDLGRAIPLFEQTVADGIRVLGGDHPLTVLFRQNLAAVTGSVP